MNKRKIALIFIIVSILFIGTLCTIYGYRLVHYYKLEHPKVDKNTNPLLKDTLTSSNNIVVANDGLYEENKSYYYKGNVQNNYVRYSGIIWRVVRINDDGSITLTSDLPITSLIYGYETNSFEESYVYKWLNEDFYGRLQNIDSYIVDTNYCADAIENAEEVNCKENKTSKITLLSVYEYLKASGSKSYLNNEKVYWTVSPNGEDKVWYMTQKGLVSNEDVTSGSNHSYGVRPVITIKGDLEITKGDGTIDNPYMFETNNSNILNEQSIGNYLTYSNQTWRIIDIREEGVKVALEGYITSEDEEMKKDYSNSSNLFDIKSKNNIGYYLNNDYYNSLENVEYLVKYPWNIFYYANMNEYNNKAEIEKIVEAKVGLLNVGDLFVGDYSLYMLMTPTNEDDDTILTVKEDGRLYADMITEEFRIRPVVVLKGDLKIASGEGTNTNPFVLSE